MDFLESHYSKSTKIVATLGPASSDESTIREMIRSGMDLARINFSHGDHETHKKTIETVRQVSREEGVIVGILSDIQGPKIRIGALEEDPMMLEAGDLVTLTLDSVPGKDRVIPLPHPEFIQDIEAGNRLLIGDGEIEFEVVETTGQALICHVIHGGELGSKKGIMAPDAHLSLSAITEKDRKDIEFALSQNTDYIALSFVRSADDIQQLKWLMNMYGNEASVIAKIEKHEALEKIDEIIEISDGIMVARGDLGLEIDAENVPFEQKRIIRLCNEAGKPVITATQMLSSMKTSPRPTRAEASDVYNAILDGTDAVMLSNESATGDYPVESVRVMVRIAQNAERDLDISKFRMALNGKAKSRDNLIANAVSDATFRIAESIHPKAIITASMSGYTTRQVAKSRPDATVFCMTPNEKTVGCMSLVWGVIPILVEPFNTIDDMIRVTVSQIFEKKFVQRNDLLVMIAGVPFNISGTTNLIQVHRVGVSGELD